MEASKLEVIVLATLVSLAIAAACCRKYIMDFSYKNFPYLGRQSYSGNLYNETYTKAR